MNQRRPWKLLIALSSLCVLGAACGGNEGQSSDVVEQATSPLSCPNNGGQHFALLYSDSTSDWDQIIATKPAFVVLGDHKDNTDPGPAAYFHKANAGIKVVTYIPMNDGHSYGDSYLSNCSQDATLHHACDNTPMDWDCTSISIATRVKNAMASGYDGVFFDETPNSADMMDYVHSCAALVKQSGSDRLVIMNPGTVPKAAMFNDDVDIVSVEHDYNGTDFASINASPWRWLSVEDGISSLSTATSHYQTFTANHGYWYDASPAYGTLSSFNQGLATFIDAHAGVACSAPNPPVPAPPATVNPPPKAPATDSVVIHTYDLDEGGAEVKGLWSVVTDSKKVQTTGYSPLTVSVPAGEVSITVANYAPYVFSHWGNSSTTQPLAVSVSGATTVDAYYHSVAAPTTATLVVRSYNLDKSSEEVTGLWTVVVDSKGKETTGYSPLSLTVPVGTTSVSMANYPPYTFNHWDNGATANARSVDVTKNVTLGGYYHSK